MKEKGHLGDITLLYVEDDDGARIGLSQFLQRRVKMLYTAKNGKEGLELFKSRSIDIVISDINLPLMNGIEMAREIKVLRKATPVVLLTAFSEAKYTLKAIEIGIDCYLLKPVEYDQMVETLETLAKNIVQEKTLRNREKLLAEYKYIVDATNIVSKTDPKGIITYVNSKFVQISGYSEDELVGRSHNIVRDPDNPRFMFKQLWDTLHDKREWHGRVTNRRKDGSKYTVEAAIFPILNEQDEVVEYIAIRHDISELLRVNAQLSDHKRKVEALRHYDLRQQNIARKKLEAGIANQLETDERYETRVVYRSSDTLSGDFYSIFRRTDGSVFLYLLDGQGHGISPALTVFAVSSLLHRLVAQEASLESLVQTLFPQIRHFLAEEEQLSFTMIWVKADGETIKYTSGGMYPFLLKDARGVTRYKANNLPFMNFMELPKIATLKNTAWESILLYSDGLIEEANETLCDFSPRAILEAPFLMTRLDRVLERNAIEDDVTVLYCKKR